MEFNQAALLGNWNSSLCLFGFQTSCKLCLPPECLHAKISRFLCHVPSENPFPHHIHFDCIFSHYDSTIIVPNLAIGRKEAWELEGNLPRHQNSWLNRQIYQPLLVAFFLWVWSCSIHYTSSFPYLASLPSPCSAGEPLQGLVTGLEVDHLHTGLSSTHALALFHQTPIHVPQGSLLPVCLPSYRSVC